MRVKWPFDISSVSHVNSNFVTSSGPCFFYIDYTSSTTSTSSIAALMMCSSYIGHDIVFTIDNIHANFSACCVTEATFNLSEKAKNIIVQSMVRCDILSSSITSGIMFNLQDGTMAQQKLADF